MLKSIELSGFKSFAKKTKLDFKHTISAIVGPNGSGKSNCAEAFRFVLGEQSMKSLRSKRNEDLIFNGTRLVPRSNRAGVKIIFDNKNRLLDIDFDDVEIERVVHRDSTNTYTINGSPVRLKDISELLAKANIGSTGHHIISQGEADRILSVPSKERKAMVEDALGLRVFHYKRKESLRKLDKTENNIREVESLRREIKPHLRFLKRQVGQVEKARELKRHLIEGFRYYFAVENRYLEQEVKEIAELRREPLTKQDVLQDELRKANEVVQENTSEDPYREPIVSAQSQISVLEQEKAEIVRNIGQIEGEIRAEEHAKDREVERSSRSKAVSIPKEEFDVLRSDVTAAHERGKSVFDITTLREILGTVKERVTEFIDSHSKEVAPARSGESIEETIKNLSQQKSSLEGTLEEKNMSIEILVKELASLKGKQRARRDSFHHSEKKVLEVQAELQKVSSTLQILRSREISYERDQEVFDEDMKEVGHLIGREAIFIDEIAVEHEHVGDRNHQRKHRSLLEKQKLQYESLGVANQEDVLREYESLIERDEFLEKEIIDLKETKKRLEELIKNLEYELEIRFKDGVKSINEQFKEFFGLLFGGGNASLQVTKEKVSEDQEGADDDASKVEGLEIQVSLPRKRIRGLEMLSGGERALTSIALLFAISQINPPPFIILDETDAALDEANSRKYGDMIENLSRNSQLVVITHNRETMSRAGHLYGVTMGGEGVSKILSVEFAEAVTVAK